MQKLRQWRSVVTPPIDLSSVYVLASRVCTRDGLRVLRDDPAGWEHLKTMRHAPELEVWESSYDENGFFCESMANSAISALVRRLRDAFERNKRAKAAQKKAKKAASKAAAKVGDQAKKGGIQTGRRNAPMDGDAAHKEASRIYRNGRGW